MLCKTVVSNILMINIKRFPQITLLFIFCFGASCKSATDIIDDQNPTIECPSSILVTIASTANNSIVYFDMPQAKDNISVVSLEQISGIPSGEAFPLGTTTNTFLAKDAAGNTVQCSFNVIVEQKEETGSQPYFIEGDPTPNGKKWEKVEILSDEFNTNTFDDTKWHRDPATDPFGWYGRAPALFESDNVSVKNGNLHVRVEKFDTPKTVNNKSWTHGGAILRSKQKAKHGYYYETKMKANSTVMSSTFWIAFPANCNTGPLRKLELDIQECVGRVTDKTHSWAKEWANIYHSNTWRHNRSCDTEIDKSVNAPAKKILSEKNNSRYFVYGCWWKSPTEMLFFLDGKFVYKITPPTAFDLEGHITMAIETYDWNPIDGDELFNNGSADELTTKYDWVRVWKLAD